MDGPHRKRFVAAFIILLLFLGINAVVSQRSTRKLIQNQQLVTHTHEVLANLDQTLALLTEAESGQRGFLITGDEIYLANYNEDLRQLPLQVQTLKRLTSDNPAQQLRLLRLQDEAEARIQTLDEVLAIARTQGLKAASHTIDSNRGRELMAEARSTVNTMQNDEQRLLAVRAHESHDSVFRTLVTFAAVNLISIALVTALYILFRRYLAFQQAATDELRRKESALRVSHQRMELAQQASNFSVFQWDIPQNVISWFGETPNIYGRPALELNSYRSWLETLHPEDRHSVHNALQDLLRTGAPFAHEFRVVWPNGEEHWITGLGRLFYDEDGRPQRLLGIHLDITERKNAERALQSSEKLAATGRLAASIAHEINNPLEAVNNLLYLLNSNEELDSGSRRYTQMAQEELGRVTHIVRQTLGFYRETTRPVRLRISDVMKSVLDLYKRRIEQKKISIKTDFSGESGILGFPGEMRQVFSNLVANALDALPVAGRIDLSVHQARNVHGSHEPGILCRVCDNGEGIRREHLHSIFEPFFTTKGEKGTGLGLWVTYGIVTKHCGWIRVRSSSRPGRSGTVFLVFLPAEPAELLSRDEAGNQQVTA
jgi:PAS domain S-box-containing protein